MSVAGFGPDEADALKELANIGMGRSAYALNRLLGIEVGLSIPELYTLGVSDLGGMLGRSAVVVRQPFTETFDGEVLALFDPASDALLAPLADDMSHDEFMLEVTSILAVAFLGTIAEQLRRPVTFLAPSILGYPQRSPPLLEVKDMPWSEALILDVALDIADRRAVCKMLLVFPSGGLQVINEALSSFLAA
jgi:chemotaxis protein CheC